MAGRVVTVARQALALGALLLGACACGSFDPVTQTQHTLLNRDSYEALGMLGAHWVAYDDQHSLTAACTNGAAGNHDPEDCSHVYQPHFDWQPSKCPPEPAQLDDGRIADPKGDSAICFHGELSAMKPCTNPDTQCYNPEQRDVSNMWGAGIGLAFSGDGKTPWIAHAHGIRGVAFDLSLSDDTKLAVDDSTASELNLRVEVPIMLPATTPVPSSRPLMRENGTVIDLKGNVHHCAAGAPAEPSFDRKKTTLRSIVSGDTQTITSELHPYGSPFWQKSAGRAWGPSPVRLGHNEFEWGDIYPPPQPDTYPIEQQEMAILGIHFQVAHPNMGNTAPLAFVVCIKNLALLSEQ